MGGAEMERDTGEWQARQPQNDKVDPGHGLMVQNAIKGCIMNDIQ